MQGFTRHGVNYVFINEEIYRLPFTRKNREFPLKKCTRNGDKVCLSGETVRFSVIELYLKEVDWVVDLDEEGSN